MTNKAYMAYSQALTSRMQADYNAFVKIGLRV